MKTPRAVSRRSSTARIASQRRQWLWGATVGGMLVLLLGVYLLTVPHATKSSSTNDAGVPETVVTTEGFDRTGSTPLEQTPFRLPVQPIAIATDQEQAKLLSTIETSLEAQPYNSVLHHIAAITYAELLQTEKAIERFESALALDADNIDAITSYSDLLLQLGRQPEAIEILESALSRGLSRERLLLALGEAHHQQGEIEAAVEAWQQAVEIEPDQALAHQKLSQARLQLGELEAAEKHARRAIELGLADRATYLALSTSLLRQGRRGEAMDIRRVMPPFEQPGSADDDRYQESFRNFASHTYTMLAGSCLNGGLWDQAEQYLMRSLELNPSNTGSLHALADLQKRRGRHDQALEVYERLVKEEPLNPVNLMNLANLATAEGNLDVAEDALRKASQVDPSGNAGLYFAQFLLETGKVSEAEQYARRAAEQLQVVDAYLLWIMTLQADGRTAEAFHALKSARDTFPSDPRLQNLRL